MTQNADATTNPAPSTFTHKHIHTNQNSAENSKTNITQFIQKNSMTNKYNKAEIHTSSEN